MTIPEHFYGPILTGIVIVLLTTTLLKVWIFNWIEITFEKEIE